MDISMISAMQMSGNMPIGDLSGGVMNGAAFVDSMLMAFQQIMGTDGETAQLGDLLELFKGKNNEASMMAMAELMNSSQQVITSDMLQYVQSQIMANSTVTDRTALVKDFMQSLMLNAKQVQEGFDGEFNLEKPIMEVVSYIKGEAQPNTKQELSELALVLKGKAIPAKVKSLNTVDMAQLGASADGSIGTAFTVVAKDVDLSTIPARHIIEQLDTGIKEGIRAGKDTLVIKLNPEGLGEVTVKLTHTAGKISVDINTASVYAQNALKSELSTLRDSLSTHGAELGSLTYGSEQFMSQQNGKNSQQGGHSFRGGSSESDGHSMHEDIATLEDYVRVMTSAIAGY